ncbi:hypothetical protein GCM10020229_30800 [Kitasatospora albolonga]|uniref:hypothetical protein n=1 Tax=Kitasatospora albolonga TaxID=68173 RepID=UPI0031F13AC1
MRPPTATHPRSSRLGRGWYLAAVLSAVLATGMCLLGWRQADQADRINADPVKVQGTVTQLAAGTGTYSSVNYQAAGRTLTATDLGLPEDARVGDRICLEYAGEDPGAVRACGKRYPQPAGVGLARISVPVALLLLAFSCHRIWLHRRGAARSRRSRPRTTVAFASESFGTGMPAISHGKRSRRRRKSGRRALR